MQRWTLDETEKTMALHCQIKVKGALDEDWSEWFDGLVITHDTAGDTLLEGDVRDQTALYGLIAKARPGFEAHRRRATLDGHTV